MIKEIEPYTRDSEVSAVRIGGHDWLNFGLSTESGPGAPAKWKQLIAGVMVLYPTVMIVNYLLGRSLALPVALAVLLTNAIAMAMVMMVFLPQLPRVLHGWLIPAAPLPIAKTVGVAVALLAVTGACLTVFLFVFPG